MKLHVIVRLVRVSTKTIQGNIIESKGIEVIG